MGDGSLMRRVNPKVFVPTVVLTALYIAFQWQYFDTSLWLDEASTWWVAEKSVWEILFRSEPFATHGAYHLSVSLWIELFGRSEISLRAFSLCCTILSLFCFHRLLRLIISRRLSVITELVISAAFLFHPLVFEVGVYARPYAFALFLSLLALERLFLFLRLARSRYLAQCAFFTILALTAHPLFIPLFLVALAAIVLMPTGRVKRWVRRRAIFTLSAALLVTAAFIAVTNVQSMIGRASDTYRFAANWPEFYITFNSATFLLLFLPLGLLLIAGAAQAAAWRKNVRIPGVVPIRTQTIILLTVWLFSTHGMLLFLSCVLDAKLGVVSRYAYFSLSGYVIALGFALEAMPKAHRWLGAAIIGLISLLVCTTQGPNPEGWREAAEYVKTTSTGNDSVLFWCGHSESTMEQWLTEQFIPGWLAPALYYELDRSTQLFALAPLETSGVKSNYMAKVLAKAVNSNRVVLILRIITDSVREELVQPLAQFLNDAGFEQCGEHTFVYTGVVVFSRAGSCPT